MNTSSLQYNKISKLTAVGAIFALIFAMFCFVGIHSANALSPDWHEKYFAQSSDGSVQVKINAELQIDLDNDTAAYEPFVISHDSGASWKNGFLPEVDRSDLVNWTNVAISDDGQTIVLASGAGDGEIWSNQGWGWVYISRDSGETFTKATNLGLHDWQAVAIGRHGEILAADNNTWYGGLIYVSTDDVNWTPITTEEHCTVELVVRDNKTVSAWDAIEEKYFDFRYTPRIETTENDSIYTYFAGKLMVDGFVPGDAQQGSFDDYLFSNISDGRINDIKSIEVSGTFNKTDVRDIIWATGSLNRSIDLKINATTDEWASSRSIDEALADYPLVNLIR